MHRGLAVLCLAVGAFAALPVVNALACVDDSGPLGTLSARSYARTVECLVNEQRAAAGLGALRHDFRLARAARRYSSSMVRLGFFDHVSPRGSTLLQRARRAGFRGRTLGETIGWGTGDLGTPAAIMEAWMESPPHRAIILGRQFRRIGLGVATGAPVGGLFGGATVTADFGG